MVSGATGTAWVQQFNKRSQSRTWRVLMREDNLAHLANGLALVSSSKNFLLDSSCTHTRVQPPI
jgi:hypothetical protein